MAVGLGKMFGFEFCMNFNYPYIAKSITEFWRRWHISLSSWFRDYVYIPLGGNRVSKSRHIFNLMVVWFLTGLWHGAAWNFVAWGLYYGIILIIGSTPLTDVRYQHMLRQKKWNTTLLNGIVYAVLFILCIAYLVTETYNPFLYFRF